MIDFSIEEIYDEYIHKSEFIRNKFIPKIFKNIWMKIYNNFIISRIKDKLLTDGLQVSDLKWLIHYFKDHTIRFGIKECANIECSLSESFFNSYSDHILRIKCLTDKNAVEIKYQIDIYSNKYIFDEIRISAEDYLSNKCTTVRMECIDMEALMEGNINTLTVGKRRHNLSLDIYYIIETMIVHLILGDTNILSKKGG